MNRGPSTPTALTWDGVTARRLTRHALAAPAVDSGPSQVAGVICGAHAQVITAAEMSIARRLTGATRGDVQHALWEDRSLVKTFGPRGTVHLLDSAGLPMWAGALSSLSPLGALHPEPVRFSDDQAEMVIAAIDDALLDRALTVDELTQAIVERAGPWAGDETMDAFQGKWPRWRQLTSAAAHRGVLCFGPNRGRLVTYTNPRTWLPGFTVAEGRKAIHELVLRYLHAYGPATPQNFAKWLNIPPRAASGVFDELRGDLERVDLEGEPAFVVGGDTRTPPEPHRGVRLLPYFDAFVVGCHPRDRLYPGKAAKRALSPTGQAGNYPVLLVDGVVGGVWHQRRSGRRLHLTVEPLRSLSAAQRKELDDEADLVGMVMGGEPSLTIGPVTVGPHA